MLRIFTGAALTAAALLLPLAGGGCAGWQANKASQAIDFDPSQYGAMVTPSNSYGYVNGEAMDMRSRH
jgi:hypothetical protein